MRQDEYIQIHIHSTEAKSHSERKDHTREDDADSTENRWWNGLLYNRLIQIFFLEFCNLKLALIFIYAGDLNDSQGLTLSPRRASNWT